MPPGKVAMAYGYTLLAPYFELDETSPAHGNTGYLPHPHGPEGAPVAPVGGYVWASRPTCRRIASAAVEALVTFTSPEAQKLYVQNGSRTARAIRSAPTPRCAAPRRSSRRSTQMSWRDELQFWPRPPIPQISDIIQICGRNFTTCCAGSSRRARAAPRPGRAED